MLKSLLLKILQKLLDLLPDAPKEKDDYFAQQDSLQGEVRRVLEKLIEKLNKPVEEAVFSIGEDGEIKSTSALLNYYISVKNFWAAVPRWLKLVTCSVIPVLFLFYIILYPLLVGDTELSSELVFRATEGKPLVRMVYVRDWPSSVVSMRLSEKILKTSINCEVLQKPISQNNLVRAWDMVINNEADIFLSAWLPSQENFSNQPQSKSKLKDLGAYMSGARIGLIVPSYVKINSIKDLQSRDFDGIIYGIDQTSRLNAGIFKAIEDYGLKDFVVDQKSDANMLLALEDALKKRKNIVVAGWAPHWMFGKWSLKFLEDPKGVFGGEETIHFFVNKGFYDKFPEICEFFKRQRLSLRQMSVLMLYNRDGQEDVLNMQRWIRDNQKVVRQWLPPITERDAD